MLCKGCDKNFLKENTYARHLEKSLACSRVEDLIKENEKLREENIVLKKMKKVEKLENIELHELNINKLEALDLIEYGTGIAKFIINKTNIIEKIILKEKKRRLLIYKIENTIYKNNKTNTNYLNKIKNIVLNNLNLSTLTNNNEFLTKTLDNLFRKQVNSLVLITVLLQPCSVVDDNYIFSLKEIDEFNIKKTLSNKLKSVSNNKKEEKEESVALINSVPCIKLIKKFMKDSTPYNNNSLNNLINHYYTISEDKENVHKLLWLLFNIYYLECIYNEFKNSTASTFETYVRLLAVKPIKKGDAYLERLKWIIKLFEEQKNTEASLPGLINFCLFVSLKEDNSHIFFGDDSDLDFDNDNEPFTDLKNGASDELLF